MPKHAKIKTTKTLASVDDFVNGIADEQKRNDCITIIKLMETATKAKAKMWGSAIIGFGDRRYKSPNTGREVDWFVMGFSPRKANISLYLIMDINKHKEQLAKLGKHKTGVGCLYINKLEDIDVKVLKELIKMSVNMKT